MMVEINISIYISIWLSPSRRSVPSLYFPLLVVEEGGKRGHNDSDNGVVDGRVEIGLFLRDKF